MMPHVVNWSLLEPMSPLIRGLSVEARRSARHQQVLKSASLFRCGEKPAALYFVITGDVRLVRQSQRGDPIVLQRAHRGIIAEASLDQPAYRCDAIAAQDTQLLAITLRAFRNELAREDYRAKWLRHLTRELHQARALSERLSLKTAAERIVHYLETEGNEGVISLQSTKKEWASELGLTHEVLYRTLAKLERRGVIEVDDTIIRSVRSCG